MKSKRKPWLVSYLGLPWFLGEMGASQFVMGGCESLPGVDGWPWLAAAGSHKKVLASVLFRGEMGEELLARGAAGGHKKLLGMETAK